MSPSPVIETIPLGDVVGGYVEAALARGDAVADMHPCSVCEECPRCVPIHADMGRYGTASAALQGQLSAIRQGIGDAIAQASAPHRFALATAQRDAINKALWHHGAQQQVNALAAASPWVTSGAALDATKFSISPRGGWTKVELGTGVHLWIADPSLAEEAQALASVVSAIQAYEAAVALAIKAELAAQQAQAALAAAEAAFRATMDGFARWADAQIAVYNDMLTAWAEALAKLEPQFDDCLRRCRGGGEPETADPPPGIFRVVLAGLGLVGGAAMVMFGQPFDNAAPEATSFGVDSALDRLEFDYSSVDSPYRTSFFAETLEELGLFPGSLGDPIRVTGVSGAMIMFEDALEEPVATILGGATSPHDVIFAPAASTGIAEEGVFALSLEFDGNLLASEFCDGRLMQFATGVDNPLVAGLYTDAGPFVGDYGLNTNTIFRQEISDCTQVANLSDSLGDARAAGLASAAGGVLSTAPDGTSRHVSLIPYSLAPTDAMFRSVFFEVESGASFLPDNTRYQATPDDLTTLLAINGLPMIEFMTGTDAGSDFDETDRRLVALGFVTSATGAAAFAAPAGTRRRRDDDLDDNHGTHDGTTVDPSPPGETDLLRAQGGTAAAEEVGREEMLAVASSHVRQAAVLYEDAVRDRATLEATESEEGYGEKVFEFVSGAGVAEDKTLSQARRHEVQALDAYRTAVAEHLAAAVLTVPSEDRTQALEVFAAEQLTEDAVQGQTVAQVRSVIELEAGDATRIINLATTQALLTLARVADETIALARTRVAPRGVGGDRPRAVTELNDLERSIESTREQRVHQPGQSEAAYRASEWFRDTRRSLAMESLVVVAENATLLDRDGRLVVGTLRQEFVADRLASVADDLDAASWRGTDPRTAEATQLRSHLKNVYGALDFLGNGDVDMSEYFHAVAASIRSRQADTNRWFVEDYLGLPSQDSGGWWDTIKVGWSVRLGTQGRTHGLGESSIEVVRTRIRNMNLTADRVVEALSAAATSPASALDDSSRDLLSRMGYIEGSGGASSRYRIPVADTTAARATAVDRPGASWLDVVSVQNAGEILVSVALPELAAVRMSAIAARLGLSGRAIVAAKIATDQTLGLAADVGLTLLHSGGEVGLARTAAESLATSWAGVLANKASNTGAARLFDTAPLRRLVSDPATRRIAVDWTASTLGIGSETLIGLAASAAGEHDLSGDDVLAALVSSAMNRTIGSVGKDVSDGAERALARLPRALREQSIVLAPTLAQAQAIDGHLNHQAAFRFDATVGDGTLDRTTGSRVFEALRTGDLSWSELQRVYTQRGKELDSVMDQVRIERDRFVQSVVVRARSAAITMINQHYDAALAATQDGGEKARLESVRQDELDKIDPVDGHQPGPSSRFAQKALEITSASREELLQSYGDRIGDPEALSVDDLRSAVLATVMTDVIQPGSAGATSDIDRSWASEWLRRGAQTVVHAEMMRSRLDGTEPPTTAAAFDTNEYVNVMTRIKSVIEARARFADLNGATIRVVSGDGTREVPLTHAQVVEANSLAAAMLHMHVGQRTLFRENVLAALGPDQGSIGEAMFAHSDAELAASAEALARYTAEEATRAGTSVDDPDTQLRARDRLYGDRMAALDALGTRIDQAAAGSPQQAELMAQWERAMNTALRDGIETYSDMANLDIIVSRMQSERGADGKKLTPEQLMRSESFSIGEGGALSHVTAQQIRSMFNDQVLMIMHHVGAHRSGSESPAKATRSLAKYGERALLALSLLGRFDPDVAGPHSALFDATKRLIVHKDNPESLLRALVAAAPPGTRSVDEALHWYLGQIETLPGLAGLTRGPAFVVDSEGFKSSLAQREWERLSSDDAALGELLNDYATTSAEIERLEFLQQFAPRDRHNAGDLTSAIARLDQRLSWVTGETGSNVGPYRRQLRADLADAHSNLETLRSRGGAIEAGDPVREAIDRLRERATGLRSRLGQFESALAE